MNEKIVRYLKLVLSMTIDCLTGGITLKTYLYNLKAIIKDVEKINE